MKQSYPKCLKRQKLTRRKSKEKVHLSTQLFINTQRPPRWERPTLIATLALSFTFSSVAGHANTNLAQLKAFSLAELADIEVTIAGKAPQKASNVAAAISVLTQEDIRNSGATTIPEVLRLVPGLQVARIDAHNWVVSSRGFSSRITNKLLVMVDGRSIYSPLYAGIWWDQHDVVMEDIERIEVIRGPGASVWGANAVNGVINIITRSALDTRGNTAITATAGDEFSYTSVRTSGALQEHGAYRVYAKYRNQDDAVFSDGFEATDGWNDWRAGFRMDWQGAEDTFTLQGDIHRGDFSERLSVLTFEYPFTALFDDDIDAWGHNILGRWSTTLNNGGRSELQAYYDKQKRNQWFLEEATSTYDLSYNHQFPLIGSHQFIVGTSYRSINNNLPDGDLSIGQVRFFTPTRRDDELYSFFVQDEIELVSETFWLTLGVKLEENDYSDFEAQPNMRLRWALSKRHMLWAAISKAVRTPSRAEHNGFFVVDILDAGPPPVALVIQGSEDMESEELLAWEFGYRFDGRANFSFDLSLFYNDYDKLRSGEGLGIVPAPPNAPQAFGALITPANGIYGESYGLEMSMSWQPSDNWKLNISYAYLDMQLHTKSSSLDTVSENEEGLSPNNQVSVTSYYKIKDDLRLNFTGRYVDELTTNGIDNYFALDTALEWRLSPSVALSLIGRNLLDPRHKEATDTVLSTEETLVEREFYLKLDWQL